MTKKSDAVSIKLSSPISVGGVDIKEIFMREPTVLDQLIASEYKASAAEQEILLIANLCGVEPAAIKQLKLRDYRKLQGVFTSFLD